MTEFRNLVVERSGNRVAWLRLHAPERRNAIGLDMLGELTKALGTLAADPELRCVVLVGSALAFSAGYDLLALEDGSFERDADRLIANPDHGALLALTRFPWPTVAAIDGFCLGGGLELAVSCDFRIATTRARFGMPVTRLGLVYGHSGLRKFVDLVGPAATRRLFLAGEQLNGTEAGAIGLVDYVVPTTQLSQAVTRLVGQIVVGAPLALRGNKAAIAAVLAGADRDLAGEEKLRTLRRDSIQSADLREGVRAFRERRRPRWRGR